MQSFRPRSNDNDDRLGSSSGKLRLAGTGIAALGPATLGGQEINYFYDVFNFLEPGSFPVEDAAANAQGESVSGSQPGARPKKKKVIPPSSEEPPSTSDLNLIHKFLVPTMERLPTLTVGRDHYEGLRKWNWKMSTGFGAVDPDYNYGGLGLGR